jgi:hypothetical protein
VSHTLDANPMGGFFYLWRKIMTREEVIATIQEAARELGHTPSLAELTEKQKLSTWALRKTFGHYAAALKACGLERIGHGYKADMKDLFEDWARLVRQLGKAPSLIEYEASAKYSTAPLVRRFGGWTHVAPGLLRYATEHDMEAEWKDELDMVRSYLQTTPMQIRNSPWISNGDSKPVLRVDEPVYGPPVVPFELLLSPTNEQGVVFLFGAMARKLGFAITQIQTAFPDCEAYREIEPGKWQRVRIEFEYESRNFKEHMHDPEKCHLIVCWKHNWEGCPLEVVELKKEIAKIAGNAKSGN